MVPLTGLRWAALPGVRLSACASLRSLARNPSDVRLAHKRALKLTMLSN